MSLVEKHTLPGHTCKFNSYELLERSTCQHMMAVPLATRGRGAKFSNFRANDRVPQNY